MESSNRIEKQVLLRAPQARVWKAITDAGEFSRWFGITLNGQFAAGKAITGSFNRSFDEAAIKERQCQLGVAVSGIRNLGSDLVFCTVERVEPETHFSFRWIPYGIDAEVDPDNEPTTLVEFELRPTTEGTLLTIVESGFNGVPEHRRLRAFRMNQGGWSAQAESIRKYVAQS